MGGLLQAVDYRIGTVASTFISIFFGVVIAFLFGWQMALVTLAVFPIFGKWAELRGGGAGKGRGHLHSSSAIGLVMRHRVLTGKGKLSAKEIEESGKVSGVLEWDTSSCPSLHCVNSILSFCRSPWRQLRVFALCRRSLVKSCSTSELKGAESNDVIIQEVLWFSR